MDTIIKLQKQQYLDPKDYSVKSAVNPLICRIARFDGGFFFHNKQGQQLAQIMFGDQTKEAFLTLSALTPGYPNTTRIAFDGTNFVINNNYYSEEDKPILGLLKRKPNPDKFSLRGNPKAYSYDIYNGDVCVANVVPLSDYEDRYDYLVRINNDENVLKILMIATALDYLIK